MVFLKTKLFGLVLKLSFDLKPSESAVIETDSFEWLKNSFFKFSFQWIAGDGLSSSLISAPSLLSSSLAKSAAVTIPKRFFDDSVVLSHGTAAMSHIRRPSGVDDRFDDRKFNPHRYRFLLLWRQCWLRHLSAINRIVFRSVVTVLLFFFLNMFFTFIFP